MIGIQKSPKESPRYLLESFRVDVQVASGSSPRTEEK